MDFESVRILRKGSVVYEFDSRGNHYFNVPMALSKLLNTNVHPLNPRSTLFKSDKDWIRTAHTWNDRFGSNGYMLT